MAETSKLGSSISDASMDLNCEKVTGNSMSYASTALDCKTVAGNSMPDDRRSLAQECNSDDDHSPTDEEIWALIKRFRKGNQNVASTSLSQDHSISSHSSSKTAMLSTALKLHQGTYYCNLH